MCLDCLEHLGMQRSVFFDGEGVGEGVVICMGTCNGRAWHSIAWHGICRF